MYQIDIRRADGSRIATIDFHDLDPSSKESVRSVKSLRGDMTPSEIAALPGGDAIRQKRILYSLVGLQDSAVVLVFRTVDALHGVDATEPGEVAILRRCNGRWRLSTPVQVPGLVAGTGRQNELLVLAYAESNQNSYVVHHLKPRYRDASDCGKDSL